MNNQQNTTEIWTKLVVLESKVSETERYLNKLDFSLTEIHRKIDHIKDDLRHQKNIPEIESKIKEVEAEVDSVKLELPEIRLVKKLFLSMIAFILTALLGLAWNTIVLTNSKGNLPQEKVNDIAKKIIDEYEKGNIPNEQNRK